MNHSLATDIFWRNEEDSWWLSISVITAIVRVVLHIEPPYRYIILDCTVERPIKSSWSLLMSLNAGGFLQLIRRMVLNLSVTTSSRWLCLWLFNFKGIIQYFGKYAGDEWFWGGPEHNLPQGVLVFISSFEFWLDSLIFVWIGKQKKKARLSTLHITTTNNNNCLSLLKWMWRNPGTRG